MTRNGVASERILADDDVAALFGIDMAATVASPIAEKRTRKSPPKHDEFRSRWETGKPPHGNESSASFELGSGKAFGEREEQESSKSGGGSGDASEERSAREKSRGRRT